MERLYGRTLKHELDARGALPLGEAIEYVRQVLAALSAAHELGIVHRDVKVENVFLCLREGSRPFVKLLDFGIAKILGGGGGRVGPSPHISHRKRASCSGRRARIAPEQALCLPVDARTDVYAVGILLYTLVVGAGPFAHVRDQRELLDAHVHQTPVAPSLVARQPVPAELDRAILTALAKRREDRFQSAGQFADELARIAARLGEPAEPLATATSSGVAPAPAAGRARRRARMATRRDDDDATMHCPSVLRRGALPVPCARLVGLFGAITVASATFFCMALAPILRSLRGGPEHACDTEHMWRQRARARWVTTTTSPRVSPAIASATTASSASSGEVGSARCTSARTWSYEKRVVAIKVLARRFDDAPGSPQAPRAGSEITTCSTTPTSSACTTSACCRTGPSTS